MKFAVPATTFTKQQECLIGSEIRVPPEDLLRADSPFEFGTGTNSQTLGMHCFRDLCVSVPPIRTRVSSWCNSATKRLFDCLCIIPSTPILFPLLLAIGLAVRLTSAGPVLFLQKRVGTRGRIFRIMKFRTLEHHWNREHNAVTTAGNQDFTPVGPFLRKWKLDELPQLWNVLIGDMSLVGERPSFPNIR